MPRLQGKPYILMLKGAFMIKAVNKLREEHLADLQGVLLKLFEYTDDKDEQEFLQDFAEKIEIKLKKLKGDKT